MKKVIMSLLAAAFLSFNVWAEDNVLKSGHPDEYIVKKGDTLWDISSTFLNSPWKWPEIWHANPQIANPHLIYPGDLIYLVYIDGKARLTSQRTLKLLPGEGGSAKLSPSVRVLDSNEAISAIPLDKIDSFLSRSRVVDQDAFKTAPYMLAGPQKRLVVGAGDEAYARGDFTSDLKNFGVYRKGELFVDPQTKEILGLHAQGVGSLIVKSLKGDIATVGIVRANEEIRASDYLLPSEERTTNSIFYPSAPDTEIVGLIIAVEGGVTQVGKYNVVMINRGEREGIKDGNVLAIYKKGEIVLDRVRGGKVALPDERAGLLMVFRTFDKMSFALVLEADRPLAVGDLLQNP